MKMKTRLPILLALLVGWSCAAKAADVLAAPQGADNHKGTSGQPVDAPRLVGVTPMDRWIDLDWTYAGTAPGGFAVEVSQDGQAFVAAEQVGPEARSASVYVESRPAALFGGSDEFRLRVAALDAAGTSASWSEPVSVRPAKPRDIEAEVRQRFDYWEKELPYNPDDPAYTVNYTEQEKEEQREAARAMIAELQKVATNNVGPRTFVIPPRVYRVEPRQITISHAEHLTIQAAGVEIIVDSEQSGDAFFFRNCTDIVLTGKGNPLIIDSEQFTMSVARILAVELEHDRKSAGGWMEIEVLPGYATDLPESERMLAFDTKGRLLNVQQMKWTGLEKIGDRRFRLVTKALVKGDPWANPLNWEKVLVPGSLLALHNNAHHQRRTHGAVSANHCKNMTYEGIRVYNGGGSMHDKWTAGHTVFRDWRLIPRPGTSRLPLATGVGQFSKNGGTLVFEDCEFGPHLDDGINLNSGMSMVGKSDGSTDIVVTGFQSPTVGSTLKFYDYTNWANAGEARVVASVLVPDTDTEILDAVNAFAKSQRTPPNARKAWRTTLDRAVSLPSFAMVVHSDYRADSIVVRGCLWRDQLAQILLLQGAKSGLIENNLFLRSTGGAVSAQFAQYWWEGPMPSNFLIRNNVFRDNPTTIAVNGFAGSASIAVFAGTWHPTSERLMRGFRIEGNTIINPGVYGIAIRNAEDVRIRHNRIVNPGAYDSTTWAATESFQKIYQERPILDLYAAIVLDAVSHAEVTDNEIVFGNPRCRRAVLMEPNCDAATVRIERNREVQFSAPH